MSTKKPVTRHELILEVWAKLGRQSIGAHELNIIQQALENRFGRGGVESPASLARILADHGAILRHPEILEADSAWRKRHLFEVFRPGELNFHDVKVALEAVDRIEGLRAQFAAESDVDGLHDLIEQVREIKLELSGRRDADGKEIIQWLTVWLQNPQIFNDWLSLRLQSADFNKKFPS